MLAFDLLPMDPRFVYAFLAFEVVLVAIGLFALKRRQP